MSNTQGAAPPVDTQLINQSLKAIAAAMGLWTQTLAASPVLFQPVPATSSSTGVAGQMAYDATHLYLAIATNTWVRVTLATF